MRQLPPEIQEVEEWVQAHASKRPIGKPVDGYNAFGLHLTVPKKAELEAIINSREHAEGLHLFVASYGVLIFQCLDDTTRFTLESEEAQLMDGRWSFSYHVDVQSNQIPPQGLTDFDPNVWAYGTQGLYQQPTTKGRSAQTLIAPTANVAAAMREIQGSTRPLSAQTEALELLGLAEADINHIQAWNSHCISITDPASADWVTPEILERIERINQAIFAKTQNTITVDWSNPEWSRGGMMVLWDAGFKGEPSKRLVHARNNAGAVLPENGGNLRKIYL